MERNQIIFSSLSAQLSHGWPTLSKSICWNVVPNTVAFKKLCSALTLLFREGDWYSESGFLKKGGMCPLWLLLSHFPTTNDTE